MKTAFIGHRQIFAKTLPQRLIEAIKAEIDNGCLSFTMGTHGEFDSLALSVCRQLRNEHPDIKIEVVLTSLHTIEKNYEWDCIPYSDVSTVMYDIEDAHYKQQITLSNRQMLDTCDTLICYVDENAYRSGAKTAMRYAEKRGLKIVNLWREQDKPFYGMTKEQVDEYWKNLSEQILSHKK
jgi:uncharacterized phage-like protein YoqJ